MQLTPSMNLSKPHIIGISGNMGAGKTTLSLELANYLQGHYVGWDDFDEISKGPDDYIDWFQRGEDYSEWDYPQLAEVLKGLKSGKSVIHPTKNLTIRPEQYIIFDAPCGRFHQQTGIYIDTWIHIDVPLDISLCRWVLRNYKNTDKTKEELLEELEYYLSDSRPLFDDGEFKNKADFFINGLQPTKKQVEVIREYLGT